MAEEYDYTFLCVTLCICTQRSETFGAKISFLMSLEGEMAVRFES